ncbi:MAG TPA: asparagine synthase (glutamine-hydrolyzing) [Ohtaekwangia sp.]|nr:asparagine synthase (glutamine-hydrolyzing) [Ohtaekwangia sp.]
MCGIGGILDFKNNRPTKDETSAFVKPLNHRGPDKEEQTLLENEWGYVWLAHRRLSIIDLTDAGNQPMVSCSGRSIIVFNGEIYNYKALRDDLTKQGFQFRSHSDTEVILNAFECWGIEKTLLRLDGMFAFALFDKATTSLYLARDRFGKKPLYYFAEGDRLIFSSDIRSFRAINSISLNLDLHALGYYFAELATPHECTIWKEVKKVKPASYLQFNHTGVSKNIAYWELVYSENCSLSRNDIIEKADYLLGQAVKKRLVADVKVSALLSGGIDSSLVVAKMAQESGERINTYSVGFKENDFNELPYARQVAEKFNTRHNEYILDSNSLQDLTGLILEYGEPFADSSMIPTYLISKQISQHEKVVLGGDGGDEVFGGYYSYHFARKFDSVKRLAWTYPFAKLANRWLPSYRSDFLVRLFQQAKLPRYTLLNRSLGFDESELRELLNEDMFYKSLAREHNYIWNHYAPASSNDVVNVLSASFKTRLLNDYLVKVDRATMYASLEMRTPFLDKELAEFGATLKPSQIFYKSGTKSILKEIAGRYFSPEFVHRKKMGFGIPVNKWFKNEFSSHLSEVILGGKQSMIDLNYGYIEKLINEHRTGKADHTHKIWSLYVFHIWATNQ